MNEDSWLETAYEDRNGGDVDTADAIYDTDECSRDQALSWLSQEVAAERADRLMVAVFTK